MLALLFPIIEVNCSINSSCFQQHRGISLSDIETLNKKQLALGNFKKKFKMRKGLVISSGKKFRLLTLKETLHKIAASWTIK